MKKQSFILSLILTVSTLFSFSIVYSQPDSASEVTAVVLRNFPVQYLTDKDGRPTGFAIDVIENIANLAGLKVNYVQVDTWAEMFEAVKNGKADLMPNQGITDKRKEWFAFTSPVETFPVSIFVRDTTEHIKGEEDLKGLNVAVVKLNIAVRLMSKRHDIKLTVFDSINDAIFELLAGNVDALIYPKPVLLKLAFESGIDHHLKALEPPLIEVKRGISVHKDNTELINLLEPAVKHFIGSPAYHNVYTKWYGKPEPFWTVQKVSYFMGGSILLIIFSMGLWRYKSIVSLNYQLVDNLYRQTLTQEALEKSERKYRALTENIPQKIFLKDRESTYISCNDNYARDLKITSAAIAGKTDYDFYPAKLADKYVTDDKRIIASGLAEDIEEEYIQEGKLCWVHTVKTPVKDDKGNITGILGIFWDITDQKNIEAEKEKLREQLLHTSKMEAVGQLAGGVAHDFNNILTAIIGYANILKWKTKESSNIRTIDQILSSSDRAAKLVQGLLAFSRKQIIDLKPTNLNDVLHDIKDLLLRIIGEEIKLTTSLEKNSLIIMADKSQLEQAVMNLATNARDSMPEGGEIVISTSLVEVNDTFIKENGFGRPGRYACLKVSDQGTGIDKETIDRIFEPFFTTKEVDKGTGLGLAMVYGIVKQHEGYIHVHSEVDKGTSFEIHLPLSDKASSERQNTETKLPQIPPGGSETVLLAEDDNASRKLSKEVLENFGYKVIESINGNDALEKYSENMNTVQLLVLDVIMPQKNGMEVYEEISRIKPEIKVIFISGYTANVLQNKGIFKKDLSFMSKPFSPYSFLSKVREVLDNSLS